MRLTVLTTLFLFCVTPLFIGCGSSTSTSVSTEEVRPDPSLGADFYDQEKYDAAIKGDAE
jgi:hypothetical protein